jgi:hypothetical protein
VDRHPEEPQATKDLEWGLGVLFPVILNAEGMKNLGKGLSKAEPGPSLTLRMTTRTRSFADAQNDSLVTFSTTENQVLR